MKSIKDYLEKITSKLQNIDFNMTEIPSREEDSTNLQYYDTYDFISATEDNINFNLTRKIFFSPISIFNLSVSFTVSIKVDSKYPNDLSSQQVLDEVEKDKKEIFSYPLTKICGIICEISTFVFHDAPLVLPPIFRDKSMLYTSSTPNN